MMNLKRIAILLMPALMLMMQSCDHTPSKAEVKNGKQGKKYLPKSTGKTSELLVVSSAGFWDGRGRDTLLSLFKRDFVMVPQSEPCYEVVHVETSEFKGLLEKHRNIFMVSIDPSLANIKYGTGIDLHATPQRVVRIQAPSVQSFVDFMDDKGEEIFNLFEQSEIRRIKNAYQGAANSEIMTRIRKRFGFSITIPMGYYIAKEDDGFMWLRKSPKDFEMGLMIYIAPMSDSSSFTLNRIKQVRDSITRRHIPGERAGSYMVVADKFLEPEVRNIRINDRPGAETRGLWETKNDFMGGAFISYTTSRPQHKQVTVVDQYVYYPRKNKRDLVRQSEAIMHTIKY